MSTYLDLFVHWKRNNETICSHADMVVQRFTNRQWEGGEGYPMIHLYKNVWLRSFYSPIQNLAPETFTCQHLNETMEELQNSRQKFILHESTSYSGGVFRSMESL
jgi:hypothetical protein